MAPDLTVGKNPYYFMANFCRSLAASLYFMYPLTFRMEPTQISFEIEPDGGAQAPRILRVFEVHPLIQ